MKPTLLIILGWAVASCDSCFHFPSDISTWQFHRRANCANLSRLFVLIGLLDLIGLSLIGDNVNLSVIQSIRPQSFTFFIVKISWQHAARISETQRIIVGIRITVPRLWTSRTARRHERVNAREPSLS